MDEQIIYIAGKRYYKKQPKNYYTFYAIKKIYSFCIYKMYLISAEGYKNAYVRFLRVRKTSENCTSMEDAHKGLGAKNISDLVLKKYMAFLKQKAPRKSKLKNTK